MTASTSSVWPLPSTPATPRISPSWMVNEMSSSSARPPSPFTVRLATRSATVSVTVDSRGIGLGQLAADHQLGQVAGGDLRRQHLGHGAAHADDRDGVRHLQHLVQLVGDEDDGDAASYEATERLEEPVDLLRHEHRRRLVEDDDARVAVEDLQDLGPLLLADAEVGDEIVRVHLKAVALAELAQSLARRAHVDPPSCARLVTDDDVLPDGQVVGQHEVLEDHADAGRDGVAGRLEVLFEPVHEHPALVGPMGAVEGLHQGRLAGAVLADDGVDGRRHDPEVHAIVGDDAGEPLDDVAQLDGRRRLPGGGHGCMSSR